MDVTRTDSIATTPKDGKWYQIPSFKYNHFIAWNNEVDKWQSMMVDDAGNPKFHELMEDGIDVRCM
jgi:expansin (peptidoglycan-binding protein)